MFIGIKQEIEHFDVKQNVTFSIKICKIWILLCMKLLNEMNSCIAETRVK